MYTKLSNFFPVHLYEELIALCTIGDYKQHGALPLEIQSLNNTTYHTYCDDVFQQKGFHVYQTDGDFGSSCRIQSTPPLYEYPIHQDRPGKSITLVIYLKGQDGTYFYAAEDTYKEGNIDGKRVWKSRTPPIVDTFTPNAGYYMTQDIRPHHSYINNNPIDKRYVFMYNMNIDHNNWNRNIFP